MAVAYVKHPLAPELKAQIRGEGFRVVDIRFKPEILPDGDIVYGEQKPKRRRKPKA